MYRILLADDEGIMLESLKKIIETEYGNECEIHCAKSGRVVVEMAQAYSAGYLFYGYPDAGHERVRLYSPYSGIRTSGYQVHADNSHVCERICGRHQVV